MIRYTFALATLGLLALPVGADEPSYDFLTAGYQRAALDGPDDPASNGFHVGGSMALTEYVFLTGNYERSTTEIEIPVLFDPEDYTAEELLILQAVTIPPNIASDVTTQAVSAGVGMNISIMDNASLYGTVGMVWMSFDLSASALGESISEADSESGYTADVGIRANITGSIELRANVNYLEIGGDRGTTLGGAAEYHLTEDFSVALGYAFNDGGRTTYLSGRYYFR